MIVEVLAVVLRMAEACTSLASCVGATAFTGPPTGIAAKYEARDRCVCCWKSCLPNSSKVSVVCMIWGRFEFSFSG